MSWEITFSKVWLYGAILTLYIHTVEECVYFLRLHLQSSRMSGKMLKILKKYILRMSFFSTIPLNIYRFPYLTQPEQIILYPVTNHIVAIVQLLALLVKA